LQHMLFEPVSAWHGYLADLYSSVLFAEKGRNHGLESCLEIHLE
jgi:hypothetical protein